MNNDKPLLVLLDNGHGINTPGKCSPDKSLLEYAYSREIVSRLSDALVAPDISTHVLVPELNDIPLSIRCARANAIYNQYKGIYNVILLSIHCNAAPGDGWSNARGWAAYTSIGVTRSDAICACLYDAAEVYLKPYIDSFHSPDKKQRPIRSTTDPSKGYEQNFTIVKNTSCPAVLTENLFQNNKEDVAFLLSEEGKQAIVSLHVAGILKWYLSSDFVPSIIK